MADEYVSNALYLLWKKDGEVRFCASHKIRYAFTERNSCELHFMDKAIDTVL